MKGNDMKQKIKLGIILGVEFVAIAVILILIFFAGKKTYKVTFDLNGGTLISGDLEQTVSQGKNATPPEVAKEGCYLHSWSASYKRITNDIVIKAVWEWESSTGFVYTETENTDYCEIVKSYEHLYGDVFVGVYHDEKKILGVQDNAFNNRDGVENIYMLDGILYIGDSAFANCDRLETVELPGTLKELGNGAFENCVSLKSVVFPDELEYIPERAFAGCTSLEEIVIPASVKTVGKNAFLGCTSLKKITFLCEDIVEVDEETEEEKVTGKQGLVSLPADAFEGCIELTEVFLPETVRYIPTLTFNSPTLKIYIPFNSEAIPEGVVLEDGWNGESEVVWNYVAPPIGTTDKNTKNKR